MRCSAYALAAAAGAASLPWGRRARAQEINSVAAYGARGDGVTDDTRALQDAINATYEFDRGPLFVGPTAAFYRVTSKLFVRDEVEVYGSGTASHIRSTNTDPKLGSGLSVFCVGNFRSQPGHSFQEETFYGCAPAPAGATKVSFSTPEDARNFNVGSALIVRSREEIPISSHPIYKRQELNECVAVDPTAGTLTLKHGLSEDFSSLVVATDGAVTDAFGERTHVAKRVTIRDMRLSQASRETSGVFRYGGAFECKFLRLDVPECSAFMSMNGLSRCEVEDVNASFARKFFDVAYFSHHSTFRRVAARSLPGATIEFSPVLHGEGAHDCRFEGITLDTRGGRRGVMFGLGTRRGVLADSSIRVARAGAGGVEFNGGEAFAPSGCEVRRTRVTVDSAADFGISLQGSGHTVDRNSVYGRPSVGQIVLQRGLTRSRVSNNRPARVRDLSGNRTNKIYNNG